MSCREPSSNYFSLLPKADSTILTCFSSGRAIDLGLDMDCGSRTSDRSLAILPISNETFCSPSIGAPRASLGRMRRLGDSFNDVS